MQVRCKSAKVRPVQGLYGRKRREAATAAAALSQTTLAIPKCPTAWPDSTDPRINAAEPAPRTQPYSKPRLTASSDRATAAAPRASVSLSGASGAKAAEWNTPTANSSHRPRAGRYASAINAATGIDASLREFRVGYAPSAWDRMLTASRRAGFSDEELLTHLMAQRRKLFEIRLQQATGQVENTSQIRVIRREIARAMTVQMEAQRTAPGQEA